MGRKLFPSPNGFEFLEHYLTELYGERGSIKHNLIRACLINRNRLYHFNKITIEAI